MFSQKSGCRGISSTASERDDSAELQINGSTHSPKMNASMPTVAEESSTNDFSNRPADESQTTAIREDPCRTGVKSTEINEETESSIQLVANDTVTEADPAVELVSQLQFSAAHARMVEAFEERVEQFEASRLDL